MAIHKYEGDGIGVLYDVKRCIHAAECVHGMPTVFDPARRPWVQPRGADVEQLAAVVEKCPTGALQYERADGKKEQPPSRNEIRPSPDGPLYVHAQLRLRDAGGAEIDSSFRVALCRCGASANKPFCDGKHVEIGFTDSGRVPPGAASTGNVTLSGVLEITPAANGPLLLRGPAALRCAVTGAAVEAQKLALCRCGQSANKPFCDGSHALVGFVG